MSDATVRFTREDVRGYLDGAIRHWRAVRSITVEPATADNYIDAFQSVRASIFGEVLEADADGENMSDERPTYTTEARASVRGGEVQTGADALADLASVMRRHAKAHSESTQVGNERAACVSALLEALPRVLSPRADEALREMVAAVRREWVLDLTPVEVVRCAVLYFYNTDPREQFESAAGHPLHRAGRDAPYVEEKLQHYKAGFVEWFGRFDRDRQERWVAAAIARFRDDVIAESYRLGRRP
jgi:hypothetical protein